MGGRDSGVVPLSAVANENGSDEDGVDEKFGGSIRVNGEADWRRLRIPARLRVGERPAGAESMGLMAVRIFAGDFGVSVGRAKLEVGVLVRINAGGFATLELSPLERFEKETGLTFSASASSS